jgi:hypothetical protein
LVLPPLNILCGRSCSCSNLPRCCGFFLWSGRWGNSCVARVRFWMSRVDVENFEASLSCRRCPPPPFPPVPGEAAVGFGEPRDRPTGHHVHGLPLSTAWTWHVDACCQPSREQQIKSGRNSPINPQGSLLESGGLCLEHRQPYEWFTMPEPLQPGNCDLPAMGQ